MGTQGRFTLPRRKTAGSRVYRDPRGRFTSKALWKWARQEKAAQARQKFAGKAKSPKNVPTKAKSGAFWAAPAKYRTSLGQKVPTQFNTAKGALLQTRRFLEIDTGVIPKSDLTERRTLKASQFYPDAKAPGADTTYETHYWRFEGLESESAVRDLLTLLQEQSDSTGPKWLAAVNIGSGFGKGADWIGSHWNTPRGVRLYLDIWKNRPSARNLLESAESGGPIWFEVVAEARVQPKEGRKHGNKSRKGRKVRKGRGIQGARKASKAVRPIPGPDRLRRSKHGKPGKAGGKANRRIAKKVRR